MLALFLTALATPAYADGHLPFTWPSGMPQPLAYYWFNEGKGLKLKESVSKKEDAGYVDHEVADQPNGVYPGVTWVEDPNFGNVFQCGNKDTLAKDVLRLADVDYGSTGKFTINVWVRNPIGSDFPDREREQIFGHGDPQEITNAPNQIHVQLENLHLDGSSPGGEILTILGDGNDFQSCTDDATVTAAQMEGTATNTDREAIETKTDMDVFPATTCTKLIADLTAEGVDMDKAKEKCKIDATTSAVTQCNRVQRSRSIKSRYFADDDKRDKVLGTIGITNDQWHMLTITTKPDGTKGFTQYLDGVARAGTPYVEGVGYDNGYDKGPYNGGDPIDPVGPMRFCGREKPGDWSGEAGARFDEERYCNLQLAHFSVYSDAMTAVQVEELRQEYFKKFFPKAVAGYTNTPGACRGPGGENDKVSSKYKGDTTLDACAKECNDHAHCKGFAYNPDANSGECLIYGPDFAGACSDGAADSPTACAALGTCSNKDQTSESSCGACSVKSGTTKETCEQVAGTWTPATWTSAGATWTEPTGGWTGDYHSSQLVVGVVESAGYTCYDVDPYDHHPTCTGTVAELDDSKYRCTEADVTNEVKGCKSTSDYSCETATCGTSNCGSDCNGCAKGCAYCTEFCAAFSGDCTIPFTGQLKEDKTSDNCPAGCTYTKEVKAAKVVVLHEPAEQYPGWRVMAGVCRSEGDASSLEAKPNGRYSNNCGKDGGKATQKECMEHCAAEPDCIGYAHSSAWCLNYGPGLHEKGDPEVWTGDNHAATTITQTKENPAYICAVKDDSADPVAEQSISRRGAMVAISLWLTSFLH